MPIPCALPSNAPPIHVTSTTHAASSRAGYLGQHLLEHLSKLGHNVVYTYHSHPLPPLAFSARAVRCELNDFAALDHAFEAAPIHVVVNCAAVSQPAVCEQDSEATCAVNVGGGARRDHQCRLQGCQRHQKCTGWLLLADMPPSPR